MKHFPVCFNAVFPLFIVLLTGYVAKSVHLVSREDVRKFNAIAFKVFMPCMVFYNIYCSDLSASIRPALFIYALICVFAIYFITTFIVLKTEKEKTRQGVIIQGIFRSNYVIIGIPIASLLLPANELGAVSLLIAVVVPLYNVLSVITLELHGGSCDKRSMLLSILRNPIILGALAALLVMLLGIRLPSPIEYAVRDMARVASPLQLFLLGAFFDFSKLSEHKRALFWVVLSRLVLVPAVVLTIAVALGFRGADFVALLGCFTASTAVSSFTMAQQSGADASLAGEIVVVTSALCSLTVFLWIFLFINLGVF